MKWAQLALEVLKALPEVIKAIGSRRKYSPWEEARVQAATNERYRREHKAGKQ